MTRCMRYIRIHRDGSIIEEIEVIIVIKIFFLMSFQLFSFNNISLQGKNQY